MHPRVPIVALALLIAGGAAACDQDPGPPCAEAYDHLIALAKRPERQGPHDRFMRACKRAFDKGRHRCIMAATTPEEALSCRPTKVTPG